MFRFLQRQEVLAEELLVIILSLTMSIHTRLQQRFERILGHQATGLNFLHHGSPFFWGVVLPEVVNVESPFTSFRGKTLEFHTENGQQAIICSVPEEHMEEVAKRRDAFNESRPDGHGKVLSSGPTRSFWSCQEFTDPKVAELLSLFGDGEGFALSLNRLQQL